MQRFFPAFGLGRKSQLLAALLGLASAPLWAQTPSGAVFTHQTTDASQRTQTYLVDFAQVPTVAGHNDYGKWTYPGGPWDVPYLDFNLIAYANGAGECWCYRYIQQNNTLPLPPWKFWANLGTAAAPSWDYLNGTRVNVWVVAGNSSPISNFMRLSSDQYFYDGSVWLQIQKLPVSRSSCLSGASLLWNNGTVTMNSRG